ncbi:MAG: DUF1259 domain-containing protein [Myxococcota bacterium]
MRVIMVWLGLAVLTIPRVASADVHATNGPLDPSVIEALTGVSGQWQDDSAFKVSVPRSDLDVSVNGIRISPPMGLTSWASFKRVGDRVVIMGDVVLLESQVSPVMDAALAGGLRITALHNHFLHDQPRIMFMHLGGHGRTEDLALAVGAVFRAIAAGSPEPTTVPSTGATPLQQTELEGILGRTGQMSNGVFRVVIDKPTNVDGHAVGKEMGVNTWAAFQGTSEQAAVAGDFAMYEDELDAVIRALRAAGIHVVAIHSHMVHETPRVIFLHYWGEGPAAALARGIRAALDAQESVAQAQ